LAILAFLSNKKLFYIDDFFHKYTDCHVFGNFTIPSPFYGYFIGFFNAEEKFEKETFGDFFV
jgi:hypothetical protein